MYRSPFISTICSLPRAFSQRGKADFEVLKWTHHLNYSYLCDDVEILERALMLCEPQDYNFQSWVYVYLAGHDRGHNLRGMNSLMAASYFGVMCLFHLLLESDPTLVLSRDDYGRSPLWWASSNGHAHIALLLLRDMDMAIDIDRRAVQTAFSVAVLSGHEQVVSVLLDTGLEMISTLYNGWTALQWAISEDHYDVAKLLLTREETSETKMKRIEEGLFLAAAMGRSTILPLLLECKPNLEVRNESDETPIFRAVEYNQLEDVHFLQSQGANVNAVAKNGWTEIFPGKGEPVLHKAIKSCAMTCMLLDHGADMEAKDAYGRTALYCAVAEGEIDTVGCLLSRGADIMSETLMRDTPWFRAHNEDRKDVLRIIKLQYPSQEMLASDSRLQLFSDAELRVQEKSLKASLGESSCMDLKALSKLLEKNNGDSTDRDFLHSIWRSAFERKIPSDLESISYKLWVALRLNNNSNTQSS